MQSIELNCLQNLADISCQIQGKCPSAVSPCHMVFLGLVQSATRRPAGRVHQSPGGEGGSIFHYADPDPLSNLVAAGARLRYHVLEQEHTGNKWGSVLIADHTGFCLSGLGITFCGKKLAAYSTPLARVPNTMGADALGRKNNAPGQ